MSFLANVLCEYGKCSFNKIMLTSCFEKDDEEPYMYLGGYLIMSDTTRGLLPFIYNKTEFLSFGVII
jgi:hypothetical protein